MPKPTPSDVSARDRRPAAAMERLTLRISEVAGLLGVSRRSIERERAAGRFPTADVRIGRTPLWRPSTIDAWLAGQAPAAPGGRRR